MQIKSVLVAVTLGEKYEVGYEVNGVKIDDIIQSQDIRCYDENGEILVQITANVPVVIEYVENEEENDV